MTRVLQFGYGRYGKFHAQAWESLGCTVTGYDPGGAGAGLLVIPPSELDWERADIVDVVTPADTHLTIVDQAIRRNKRVFCEKPLSTNARAIRWLMAQHPEGYKNVSVGYGYRFAPGMEDLRRRLHLEPPKFLKVDFYANKEPRKDTNMVWSDGVHCMDLIDWLLPGNPEVCIAQQDTRWGLACSLDGWGFEVSNCVPGAHPDPVIGGDTLTTKRVIVLHQDDEVEVLDFSTVSPVDLLVPQFQRLLDGETHELGTVEESLGIAEVLS